MIPKSRGFVHLDNLSHLGAALRRARRIGKFPCTLYGKSGRPYASAAADTSTATTTSAAVPLATSS
uniref:Expressed protein n=1 Tax=Schizophyllum commune (strain H4-8 / FGSC 9210) TaxID=578458 RepID=D8Q9Y0_SCHCM